jgi:hypothetical protein
MKIGIPRRDVKMLPVVADIIFCTKDTFASTTLSAVSSAMGFGSRQPARATKEISRLPRIEAR